MCTAIAYRTDSLYFGRTLDLEFSYREKIVITPKKYKFKFNNGEIIDNHNAIIGVGIIMNGYPLYYDAANEYGLCIAGLNFPKNAIYNKSDLQKLNLASFEFIPYLLSKFKTVDEVIDTIKNINITDTAFSANLFPSPLHWIIADKNKTITAEPVKNGIKIFDNPVGVLTNNPTFDYHLFSLNNYANLSPYERESSFSDEIQLENYAKGLSAHGLPGDLSSNSRFIRASYTLLNSVSPKKENGDVTQFFHILGSVSQTMGSVRLDNGDLERTVYTSCYDAEKSILFFNTYCNNQLSAVKLLNEDLSSNELIVYDMIDEQIVNYIN